MKLRTKQAIGFAIVVSLIIPAALVALYTFGEMHGQFEALRDDVVPGAMAMAEMEQTLTRAHHHLMEYMVHGKEEDKELARSALEDLEKSGLEHLEHERHIGPEERAAAEEMMAKVKKFASAVIGTIDLKNRGLSDAEVSKKEDETVHPAEAALIEQLREHRAVHMEELAQAERAVYQAHVAGTGVVLLGTVCAVLVAAGVVFLTSRMIVKPLQDLEKGTEMIAQGDLDHRIGASRKDEIGQVARSFDRMAEHLSKTLVSKSALEEANAALTSEITERKRAEEDVARARDDYLTTVDLTDDIIIRVDTGGRWTFVSDGACQFWGRAREELTGTAFVDYLHPDDHEKTAVAVERVKNGERVKGLVNRQKTPDGWRTVEWNGVAVFDEEGRYEGFQATGRDITERKQAEEDLARKMKELEEFGTLAAGREIRMIELKDEVNRLLAERGAEAKYEIVQ